MSQVMFDAILHNPSREGAGFRAKVVGGWDYLRREFFLSVIDEDDAPVWTSTDEPSEEDKLSPIRFLDKLCDLQIVTPVGFWILMISRTGNEVWERLHGEWKQTTKRF